MKNKIYRPTLKLRTECACVVNCREYKKGEYLKTLGGHDKVFRSLEAAIKAKFACRFGNHSTITIEHIS